MTRWHKTTVKNTKSRDQILYIMDFGGADEVDNLDMYVCWAAGNKQQVHAQGYGSLGQAAAELDTSLPIVLVLPASNGLLTQVDIPSKSQSQRRAALPFKLQSQVIDNIEDWQLAWGNQTTSTMLQVAGYPQVLLQSLVSAVLSHNLRIKQIVLDAQLLPSLPNSWTLLTADTFCLLNDGQGNAYRFDQGLAQAIQTQLIAEQGLPESIKLYGLAATEVENEWLFAATNEVDKTIVNAASDHDLASLMLAFYSPSHVISLLPTQTIWQHIETSLKGKAGSLVLWLGVILLCLSGLLLVNNIQLEKQQKSLDATLKSLSQSIQQQLPENAERGRLNGQLMTRLADLSVLNNLPSAPPLLPLLNAWAEIQSNHQLINNAKLVAVDFDQQTLQVFWQTSNVKPSRQYLQNALANSNQTMQLAIKQINDGSRFSALQAIAKQDQQEVLALELSWLAAQGGNQ